MTKTTETVWTTRHQSIREDNRDSLVKTQSTDQRRQQGQFGQQTINQSEKNCTPTFLAVIPALAVFNESIHIDKASWDRP